jgi:hypothetical protein
VIYTFPAKDWAKGLRQGEMQTGPAKSWKPEYPDQVFG